jgi:hypothetical protein
VLSDAEIRASLSEAEVNDVFRVEKYLGHVDALFGRVFGEADAGATG